MDCKPSFWFLLALTGCQETLREDISFERIGEPIIDRMGLPLADERRCRISLDWVAPWALDAPLDWKTPSNSTQQDMLLVHYGFDVDGRPLETGEPQFEAEVRVTYTITPTHYTSCDELGAHEQREGDEQEFGMNSGVYEAVFGEPPPEDSSYSSDHLDPTRIPISVFTPLSGYEMRTVEVTCPDGTPHTVSVEDDHCPAQREYLAMVEACGLSKQFHSACWSVEGCNPAFGGGCENPFAADR